VSGFPREFLRSNGECVTVNATSAFFDGSSTEAAEILTSFSSLTFKKLTTPLVTVATVLSLVAQVTF